MIYIIKCLAVVSLFILLYQFYLYATNRSTPEERRSFCLPLGIFFFLIAVAGFATRDLFLVFLSVALVALSLWLGPTTWRGKENEESLTHSEKTRLP